MDFALSAKAQDYLGRLKVFMAEHVIPAEPEYGRQLKGGDLPWNNPRVMEELKAKAKAAGLWNLFLPDPEYGPAFPTWNTRPWPRSQAAPPLRPRCSTATPRTGNMEVLVICGSEAQKRRWLRALLDGTIRSAFCMTEPAVASSDATNMQAAAVVEGDQVVCNGVK